MGWWIYMFKNLVWTISYLNLSILYMSNTFVVLKSIWYMSNKCTKIVADMCQTHRLNSEWLFDSWSSVFFYVVWEHDLIELHGCMLTNDFMSFELSDQWISCKKSNQGFDGQRSHQNGVCSCQPGDLHKGYQYLISLSLVFWVRHELASLLSSFWLLVSRSHSHGCYNFAIFDLWYLSCWSLFLYLSILDFWKFSSNSLL